MSEKDIFFCCWYWGRGILFCLNVREGLACERSRLGEFVGALLEEVKELGPPARRGGQYAVPTLNPEGHPNDSYGLGSLKNSSERENLKYRLPYIPEAQNFPLVDGFFLLDSNPKTLVGLQITTAGEHRTIHSTVRQFNERMAAYFKGWEELSREMSWEIIYVQHADSTPMTGWRRCDVVNSDGVGEKENKKIAWFRKEKVHQYQLAISSGDAPRSP
ncbi:putative retrotransposon hot spot protein (RHS,) [Trypanosoma cruzi]|uniref:Putative retrotransposon hot spot protein (RHS,) n=1 Tax=Trypanosoma cruzi TaxID=5693 RepID=A0A2V2UM42_TRYCR|nr:putative retrotransposon hot spot protein (RHS,) [Trypanosoma cruzi]